MTSDVRARGAGSHLVEIDEASSGHVTGGEGVGIAASDQRPAHVQHDGVTGNVEWSDDVRDHTAVCADTGSQRRRYAVVTGRRKRQVR